jgi:hypothetical protein
VPASDAGEIVDAVLEDLKGRRGVGDELWQVESSDTETWEEIKATLRTKVEEVLASWT